MTETVYRVIRHVRGFYVEVSKPGEPVRVTDNFANIGAAYSWIDQEKEQDRSLRRPWLRFFRR